VGISPKRTTITETRKRVDQVFTEGSGRLVRETGRAIAQVAKDPGINACTLGNWGLSNLKLLVRGLV